MMSSESAWLSRTRFPVGSKIIDWDFVVGLLFLIVVMDKGNVIITSTMWSGTERVRRLRSLLGIDDNQVRKAVFILQRPDSVSFRFGLQPVIVTGHAVDFDHGALRRILDNSAARARTCPVFAYSVSIAYEDAVSRNGN